MAHRRKRTPMSGNEVRRMPGVTMRLNVYKASQMNASLGLNPFLLSSNYLPPAPNSMNKSSIGLNLGQQTNLLQQSLQAPFGNVPKKIEFSQLPPHTEDPPPLLSPSVKSPGYELDIRIVDCSSEAFAKRIRARTNTTSSSKSTSSVKTEPGLLETPIQRDRSSSSRPSASRQHTPSHPYIVFRSSSTGNPSQSNHPAEPKKERSSSHGSHAVFGSNVSPKTHREVVRKVIRKEKLENAPLPGIACQICNTRKTGQWRRGPDGPRTLCNGCGLAFARLKKK